jgi:hypothetical protein
LIVSNDDGWWYIFFALLRNFHTLCAIRLFCFRPSTNDSFFSKQKVILPLVFSLADLLTQIPTCQIEADFIDGDCFYMGNLLIPLSSSENFIPTCQIEADFIDGDCFYMGNLLIPLSSSENFIIYTKDWAHNFFSRNEVINQRRPYFDLGHLPNDSFFSKQKVFLSLVFSLADLFLQIPTYFFVYILQRTQVIHQHEVQNQLIFILVNHGT